MPIAPTAEQVQVITHPQGHHARVLAVAGSGKTTTMAYRARYLIEHQRVNPQQVQVLMFNRLARDEFVDRLTRVELAGDLHPKVNTFHSYAYGIVTRLERLGLRPPCTHIDEDQVKILIHQAIREVGRAAGFHSRDVPIDADEAESAIGLWKGSLIPPERAGYHGHELMPKVYEQFERLRISKHQITFDDYVPIAVEYLASTQAQSNLEQSGPQFLIVDEYQDVNYGQQRLVELLAGDRADVMVVGDDDQTIYEWRGARPSYMIREFPQVFSNKPHVIYHLSSTFRFGPVLAQAAHNVIAFNTTRVDKALVAFDHDHVSQIHLRVDQANQTADADHELCSDIQGLLAGGIEPRQIIVLGRMFSQLHGLEAMFMGHRIPYHVLGAKPFLERREVRGLMNYICVARELHEPLTQDTLRRFLDIVNFPSRMLRRNTVETAARQAMTMKASVAALVTSLTEEPGWQLNYTQEKHLNDLLALLQSLNEQLTSPVAPSASDVLAWLNRRAGLDAHFDDFYGKGESSEERKSAVQNLIAFAHHSRLDPLRFLHLVETFDPTQGAPEDKQIRFTSIFRTKGLEYDYVFIPHCNEGSMPCLYESGARVFDLSGTVREPESSEALENERRLFYVGITRARKAVVIGVSKQPEKGVLERPVLPSRFLEELQLPSVTDILEPLQAMRQGRTQAREQLAVGVHRWAGVPWVKRSLTDTYIAGLADSVLAGQVATTVAGTPEMPFRYSHSYPTTRVIKPSTQLGWNTSLPDWLTGENEAMTS